MIVGMAVLAAAAMLTAVLAKTAVRRSEKMQEAHAKRAQAESAREAHYMRNFLDYDGSQQEEYDG